MDMSAAALPPRSGRITLTGVDSAGRPVKIVGIDTIEMLPGNSEPLATTKDGTTYRLGPFVAPSILAQGC